MKKFYLLTFNEDWADEHNVPATACFTENEYKSWCEALTGAPNKKYEEELTEHNKSIREYEKYTAILRKYHQDNSPEAKAAIDAARVPYVNSIHDRPRKFFSGISAYLGNNGEGFGESFENYPTGQALVIGNIVKVFEVNSSFHKIFHKAHLSDLSLSNVFDGSLTENYDYDFDEEEKEDEE